MVRGNEYTRTLLQDDASTFSDEAFPVDVQVRQFARFACKLLVPEATRAWLRASARSAFFANAAQPLKAVGFCLCVQLIAESAPALAPDVAVAQVMAPAPGPMP